MQSHEFGSFTALPADGIADSFNLADNLKYKFNKPLSMEIGLNKNNLIYLSNCSSRVSTNELLLNSYLP